MFERLERLKAERQRNIDKRAELDEKIKELDRKIIEEEKASIHEVMKAADMTPAELARLITFSKSNVPMSKPIKEITEGEDEE